MAETKQEKRVAMFRHRRSCPKYMLKYTSPSLPTETFIAHKSPICEHRKFSQILTAMDDDYFSVQSILADNHVTCLHTYILPADLPI